MRPSPAERKGNIMPSIKQTGESSYQITVSCGYNSEGKKIRRKTTFRPDPFTSKGNKKSDKTIEKEVAAYAAEFERKVLSGQYTDGHTLTFEKYADQYLGQCAEGSQTPRTLQTTKAAIADFVPSFGYMALENLTPLYLQEYFNQLSRRKKANGATLSHGTVKRKAAVLSAMLSQAVRWNLLTSNPMQRVQIKSSADPEEEKPMFFTQEQAEAFLAALDDPLYYQYGSRKRKNSSGNIYDVQEYQSARNVHLQLKLFFYLAMFTGCRRGELLALTWSDLNFNDSSVAITKSTCRIDGDTIIKATKTRKSVRTIAVPAVVMDLAKMWKANQTRYRLTIGSQWEGSDFVFIRWNGLQMGLETPYRAFHRIIKNYNANRKETAPELPLIPLHGLRHTAATLLIGSGVDIRTVSGRLGHSNTSTTLNIYSHALEELDRKAADVLADVLIKKA